MAGVELPDCLGSMAEPKDGAPAEPRPAGPQQKPAG